MKRVVLLVGTNLAVLAALMIVVRSTGLDGWVTSRGLALGPLLGFVAVFGFGGAFLSLAVSRWISVRSTGARIITTPQTGQEQWLVLAVRRHADAALLPMPAVAIYAAGAPNAFATGATRKRALIAVSTGLLEQLAPDEIDAVLAHEVAHIAKGDMVTLTLLQGVLNTFVIFTARVLDYIVDRAVFRTQDRVGPAFLVVSLIAELALGVLASAIVLAVSRRREFRADAGAAALVGASPMIAAPRRLERGTSEPLPVASRAFGIRSSKRSGRTGFALTPPSRSGSRPSNALAKTLRHGILNAVYRLEDLPRQQIIGEVPAWFSLTVTNGLITDGVAFSWLKTRKPTAPLAAVT